MPKGRHLKPEFFTDKHIVSVSPLARLLYQGLWCYAADCGHVDDEPIELKMRILPADNCDVEELLAELVAASRIERGEGQINLPKLGDHARIDKRYETECDRCKERREHAENGSPQTPEPVVSTQGPRSEHAVTTRADPPNHAGDGDGDGDGEVMVSKPPARKRGGHQLPDTWQPNDQHRGFAAENRINLDREIAKFRDHHQSKGSVMKDWDAAFRKWLRNAQEWRGDAVGPIPARPAVPHVSELEQPPDGLSPQEYAEWDHARRQRQAAGR